VRYDSDSVLVSESERLNASYFDGSIRNTSGAVTEWALIAQIAVLVGQVGQNVLSDYIFAGPEALRSRERDAVTLRLDEDEALAFAEVYLTNRAGDNLILVEGSRPRSTNGRVDGSGANE
jgi:hypothetical protein